MRAMQTTRGPRFNGSYHVTLRKFRRNRHEHGTTRPTLDTRRRRARSMPCVSHYPELERTLECLRGAGDLLIGVPDVHRQPHVSAACGAPDATCFQRGLGRDCITHSQADD